MSEWVKSTKSCLYVDGNDMVDDAENSFSLEAVKLLWEMRTTRFRANTEGLAFDKVTVLML